MRGVAAAFIIALFTSTTAGAADVVLTERTPGAGKSEPDARRSRPTSSQCDQWSAMLYPQNGSMANGSRRSSPLLPSAAAVRPDATVAGHQAEFLARAY